MTDKKSYSIQASNYPHGWNHPDTMRAWVCRLLSSGSPCSFFVPGNCPVGLRIYRRTVTLLYNRITWPIRHHIIPRL